MTSGNGSREISALSDGNLGLQQLTTCYCCNYEGDVDTTELNIFNQYTHTILRFDGNCLGNCQYPCPVHFDIISVPPELKKKHV